MTPDDFRKFLQGSLADRKLSRGERRVLGETLRELDLSPQDFDEFRRTAFEIVREQIAETGVSTEPLNWLEEIVKLLARASGTTPDSKDEPRGEAIFSPGDGCRNRISGLFRQATVSADVCVFTITDDRITSAILDAHRRGVRIRIVTDNDKSYDVGSDIEQLRDAGIDVRPDTTDYHMHHKFAIFDGKVLLNGSYNWTRSAADYNEENIIISTEPEVRDQFQKTFDRLWKKFGELRKDR